MPFGTPAVDPFDRTLRPNRVAQKIAEKRVHSPTELERKRSMDTSVKGTLKRASHIAKTPARLAVGFFRNLFKSTPAKQKLTEEDLINAESQLGATLFGPVPNGHRREFFRFQHNVWVYHESWTTNGKNMESTITYEVRENGVYKLPLGGQYIKIKGAELENFRKAVHEYLKIIKSRLY